MKRKLISLFTALLCIFLLAQTAAAAQPVSVRIPVEIQLKGTLPSRPEGFKITLEADDPSYPMPVGAEGGEYTMTIYGADTRSFTISFDHVGIYTYTIYQQKGDNPKCTYDGRAYELKICVTNGKDGSLEVTVLVWDEDGVKVSDVEFENKYKYEPTDIPQTDDQSDFPRYFMMAGGSLLVLLGLFLTRERDEEYM